MFDWLQTLESDVKTLYHHYNGDEREDKRYQVGAAHRGPHTLDSIIARQYYQEGYQKQQLARERQEDGYLGLAYRLEEILYHYLGAHHRVEYEVYPESLAGYRGEGLVGGEQPADGVGKRLTHGEAHECDADSDPYTYI